MSKQTMSPKVFLSWSGPLSKQVASAFREWLPVLNPAIVPFFSASDIAKGVSWPAALANELQGSSTAILCVTSENLRANWVLFEAGAISKHQNTSKLCPFLIDIEPADLPSPLNLYQVTKFEKRDVFALVQSINAGIPRTKRIDEGRLEELFDKTWPWFERKLHQFLLQPPPSSQEPIDLRGKWKSTFTWNPRTRSDSGKASDLIEITQDGGDLRGRTIGEASDYAYAFSGRIVGENVLGEWKSLKRTLLFGVFQLVVDVDNEEATHGYWIGNGKGKPYFGKWDWKREK